MNAAFVEFSARSRFDCFIFHDVDLVPEDDRNVYSCGVQPLHLSVGVDQLGYQCACLLALLYVDLFITI